MRRRIYYAIALIIATGFSTQTFCQVPDIDSLQKAILKSVQQKLKKEGASIPFFDTSKIFSGKLPVNLDKIFKEVNKSVAAAKSSGDINKLRGAYYNLSTIDSMRGNYKDAYENYKLYTIYRDSLQKMQTEKRELQAKMQYEFDKKQAIAKAEQEKKDAEARRVRNLQYFAIAGLTMLFLVILLIALIQWRNNKQKKKANALLQLQKQKVESALSELKSAQAQLIQSEKMASLGELTAGIAHEIQNPLNFVNNFSEVNKELADELEAEAAKGNVDEVLLIAKDIKDNSEKINHHGNRAGAIVKGMLQHSRTSTGQKEPTDINVLCDEYLRLSSHNLRAKDKTFNVNITTDFDKDLSSAGGKMNIVPENLGRALLNLLNNAFYAVNEKAKQDIKGYSPRVTVATKKNDKNIEISVKDNGIGVPDNIKEKIFQPFFTTKPAGQGTGLGLSLAYDMVKAHGGEIKLESKNGEGSKFIIVLPVV